MVKSQYSFSLYSCFLFKKLKIFDIFETINFLKFCLILIYRFKGIREGGVSDNSSWYVFMQAKDGAFEAFPVEEWYNFQPINRYKALSAEEAEKEFER